MLMMLMALRLAWAVILLGWPAVAMSAEPVRHIGIYVQPFYEAAQTPDGRPKVIVGEQFNGLLSSNRREDILAARDLIAAKPAVVTPMTMMTIARLRILQRRRASLLASGLGSCAASRRPREPRC